MSNLQRFVRQSVDLSTTKLIEVCQISITAGV